MSNDDNRRDLHHSQGVLVADILSGVDPSALEDDDVTSDAMVIWMSLITERCRLEYILKTRSIIEPMFGAPTNAKMLTDDELADINKKLIRVNEMAAVILNRRKQLAAVFAKEQP